MQVSADFTLQVNLSPGDIPYAHMTCPDLIAAHRSRVSEVIGVVDCCRPQKTKIIDPDQRFPEPVFQRKVAQITAIAEGFVADGLFDRVVFLRPDDDYLNHLWSRYLGNAVTVTHDYGGCALTGYLAALDAPRTRYLIHYDADMMLYQERDYDWVNAAADYLDRHSSAIAATPRICPPIDISVEPDCVSCEDGRPLVCIPDGWLDDWFSTRCFLMDREKLCRFLPLVDWRLRLELFGIRWLNRGYPRSPEVMLFRRLGRAGQRRLILNSRSAWLLHPQTKPDRLIALWPEILRCVRNGQVPDDQRGCPDLRLDEWNRFLSADNAKNRPRNPAPPISR